MLLCGLLLLTACNSSRTQVTETSDNATQTSNWQRQRDAASYNVRLSMGYLQQGNVEWAQRKILIALEQAPDWGPALGGMALFLAATGEPERAESYYKKAIAADPDSGDLQNNYGIFLCQQGRYQQGVARFLTAIDKPQYLNQAGAYENAGLCTLKMADTSNAERYFRKALEKNPQQATSLYELSKLYYAAQDYVKAERYLQYYRRINDDNSVEVKRLAEKISAHKVVQPMASLTTTDRVKVNTP